MSKLFKAYQVKPDNIIAERIARNAVNSQRKAFLADLSEKEQLRNLAEKKYIEAQFLKLKPEDFEKYNLSRAAKLFLADLKIDKTFDDVIDLLTPSQITEVNKKIENLAVDFPYSDVFTSEEKIEVKDKIREDIGDLIGRDILPLQDYQEYEEFPALFSEGLITQVPIEVEEEEKVLSPIKEEVKEEVKEVEEVIPEEEIREREKVEEEVEELIPEEEEKFVLPTEEEEQREIAERKIEKERRKKEEEELPPELIEIERTKPTVVKTQEEKALSPSKRPKPEYLQMISKILEIEKPEKSFKPLNPKISPTTYFKDLYIELYNKDSKLQNFFKDKTKKPTTPGFVLNRSNTQALSESLDRNIAHIRSKKELVKKYFTKEPSRFSFVPIKHKS